MVDLWGLGVGLQMNQTARKLLEAQFEKKKKNSFIKQTSRV